jgi:starch synthase
VKVLFATAELAPFVKVGGLADASAGLVAALGEMGVEVEVALPAYADLPLVGARSAVLSVPGWAAPAAVHTGELDGFGHVSLIDVPGMARPHPYLDDDGSGWSDNDRRFFAFSAAVAALIRLRRPDVLHLNDWHTGATLGFADRAPKTVLTIHNLAYQGTGSGDWLERLPNRPEAYEWFGGINPLSGAIALADKIVAVSPTYAAEILDPDNGFGLDGPLRYRGDDLVGIRNGVETAVWNPATDPHLGTTFSVDNMRGKHHARRALRATAGWAPGPEPIVGMVTRLTDQKGIDLALGVVDRLAELGARMVLLGSGERDLANRAATLARAHPETLAFFEGYDEPLAHRIFAGSDLYLVPSRFEPCGLTQMQAMIYGSIPIVTDVGGLHDTVIDADHNPSAGTGFVAAEPTVPSLADAVDRALRAWRSTRRRGAIRRRGMTADWSWRRPAAEYLEIYQELAGQPATSAP